METFVVGTAIAFAVVLFAAMAIAPMVIELTTSRSAAPLLEDQILSIEPVGLDRATRRIPTPLAAPGNTPFHREAA